MRQRITSSPLKRLEEEEKEQQRRGETVRLGLRLSIMGVIVLSLFSVMVVRLWSLQVLQGSKYRQQANNLATGRVVVAPPRGLILMRGGQVIVANKVMSVVTLSRQVAAQNPAVIRRLAVALDMTVSQINAAISNQQDSVLEPVPVAVGVSPAVITDLSEHRAELPGVTVRYVAERSYPDGSLGAQLLGYVADISAPELKQLKKQGYLASDVIGQSGIEAQYEKWLRGKPGQQVLYVDAAGDPVGTKSSTPPVPGDNVVLNIDLGLEKAAQSALDQQITALRGRGLPANSGAVVVLDPQTGAVLAMASAPSYPLSWWVGGISSVHYHQIVNGPILNRATQGVFTPGSTFKLATATAALDDGLITPYTYLSDPGSFTVGNMTFLNNPGDAPCGSCDVSTALTISDDVFFYTLGYDFWAAYQNNHQYGLTPIQNTAAKYGLGQPTGVDLPGESYGQVDSPLLRQQQHRNAPKLFPYNTYTAGDNVEMAFGQGETVVTPLQLANAYATFANGGTRYAPEVAGAVLSPTGQLVTRFRPKVMGHVSLPSSTYDAIFAGLKGVVTSPTGTGYGAFIGYHYSQLPVAGKTGTATTSTNPNAQPTAWFVAFGPATGSSSAPQYCAAVVIPQAGYGATASAPVVRKIFDYLIKHPVGPLSLKAPTAGG